jgi:DNA-binding helix-hairpin-helix protein with protein kinase domain
MPVYLERVADWVSLLTLPYAGGGEADHYAAQGHPSLSNKIYKAKYRTPERETKIGLQCRIASPDPRLVWPRGRVYDRPRGAFLGVEMERIRGRQVTLADILTPKARAFHRIRLTLVERLLIGAEVADITHSVHQTPNFVIGDLNDGNWLIEITPDGHLAYPMSIHGIDCDSYQITARDPRTSRPRTFTADVAVEQFRAPEIQGINLRGVTRTGEEDNFALACILLTLIKGAHPFTALSTAPGARPQRLGEWIRNGWFPHAPARPLPTGWKPVDAGVPFASLPRHVRDLAIRTFRDGHQNHSARATAAEWRDALRLWAEALDRRALQQGNWFWSAFSTLDAYRALRPYIMAFSRKKATVIDWLSTSRPHHHFRAWLSRPEVRRKALAVAFILAGLIVVPFIRLPAFGPKVPHATTAVGPETRRLKSASPGDFDWQDAPREWRALGGTREEGTP